jgi:hypothetical protein
MWVLGIQEIFAIQISRIQEIFAIQISIQNIPWAQISFWASESRAQADCLMIHVNSAQRFGKWVVSSEGYCNLAFVSRRDLREAVDTMWPDGADSLRKQALEV